MALLSQARGRFMLNPSNVFDQSVEAPSIEVCCYLFIYSLLFSSLLTSCIFLFVVVETNFICLLWHLFTFNIVWRKEHNNLISVKYNIKKLNIFQKSLTMLAISHRKRLQKCWTLILRWSILMVSPLHLVYQLLKMELTLQFFQGTLHVSHCACQNVGGKKWNF